jgi:hypothetical protein
MVRRVWFFFLVSSFAAFLGFNAFGQLIGSIGVQRDVEGTAGAKVDWTTGELLVKGSGAPNMTLPTEAARRLSAEKAAKVDAQRNMLEAIQGVRVDAMTTVENFTATSDVIKTQVSGFLRGASLKGDPRYLSDGAVEVVYSIKLTGELADALLPKTPSTPPAPIIPSDTSNLPDAAQVYTGLIVDARGLNVKPAMAPKILNESGKEVYGSAWINRDWAVQQGMVGYLKDMGQAQKNDRVTDKPLVVKAVKTVGERVDVVISDADAYKIHGAAENLSFLQKCRVIVLVD